MTPETLNRYNLKGLQWKYFFPRSIPHKMCSNYILLKVFCLKSCFRQFFNKKVRASIGLWWYFYEFRVTGSHDSQVANGSAASERGLLQGVLPASYWSPGSHIWLPAARLRTFFMDILIRVNFIFIFNCLLGITWEPLMACWVRT
jgi:hypothetical protein